METTTLPLNSAILEKTRELCTLILGSPEYKGNLAKIEAFFADSGAQDTYREFSQLGQELHSKQHDGSLTQEDVSAYDKKQEDLRSNPVTDGFMSAEENLNSIAREISQHVGKSLELGRLPDPEDFESSGGCCGGGGGGEGGGCCSN